jgi:hypothetical protein
VARVAQPDQIDFIMADLEDYTQGELVALGLNLNANLRSQPPVGTPVDTGWARANWMPSVGEPILLEDKRNPEPGDVAIRAADQQKGLNDLLSYRLTDGPIFSTNNVVYIVPLNEGHSPQSPPGFVQAAMEKAIRETEVRAVTQRGRAGRASAARSNKRRPR